MIRLATTTLAIALTCLCYTASAWAEICMYRDAQGNVTYSNVTDAPPKDATKIRCFREAKPAAPSAAAKQPAPGASNFPSVDRDTQRQRDIERRRLIEQELETERSDLAEARQALEEQESVRLGSERNYQRYLDRVQPFRDAVAEHERNIEALQREIDNLR